MSLLQPLYSYTPCNRESIEGKRHYRLPDGSLVPSVTTILSATQSAEKTASLENWRNAIGRDRAEQITTDAANRGTRMHAYLEHYVLHGEMKKFPSNPYAHASWYMAEQVIKHGLKHVTAFRGVEVPLFYSGMYAGSTDVVANWKGKDAILDYKQSNRPKDDAKVEDYKIQLCAYGMAHNSMHHTNIQTGVILMAVQPKQNTDKTYTVPQYQEWVIEGDEYAHYENEWLNRVEQYYLSQK